MPLSYVKSNVDATVNVNSTAIDSADYNYSNEALTLQFQNGSRYEYTRVPRFVFHGLQEAASKGKFINNYVINSFNFKRV
jgi:hypothetical protein|tara:strand:- start:746 stop:985 length:240 start_codon:yes stop_codon:yes gene_type:complete